MKRIIPVLLVSALAVIGCDNKKKPTQSTQPVELQPQPLPPAPAPVPAYPEPTPAPTPAPVAPKAAPAKPAKAESATPSRKAAAKSTKARGTYKVKQGDTLAAIAKAQKTTVKKIVAANPGLNPDRIYVGQKLKMP